MYFRINNLYTKSDAREQSFMGNGVITNPLPEIRHSRRLFYRVHEVKICGLAIFNGGTNTI
jgi:hypothetical protein